MSLFFFLSSVDPPEIIVRPVDQQVKNGGIATFFCQATGDPSPVLQWRKNGKRVSGTQSRYLVREYPVGGALLRIEPVRAQRDEAQYECVAENGVGDAVAADAMLKVYESTYQEFLYFQYHTLLFSYNLSPVMTLLRHVVDPKLCSTANPIQGWPCVGHERCQLYILLAS